MICWLVGLLEIGITTHRFRLQHEPGSTHQLPPLTNERKSQKAGFLCQSRMSLTVAVAKKKNGGPLVSFPAWACWPRRIPEVNLALGHLLVGGLCREGVGILHLAHHLGTS